VSTGHSDKVEQHVAKPGSGGGNAFRNQCPWGEWLDSSNLANDLRAQAPGIQETLPRCG